MNIEWNDTEAEKLVGKYVLIGLTYMTHEKTLQSHKQYHGVIKSVSQTDGVIVSLKGTNEGEELWLPPDYTNFQQAKPGSYKLNNTEEIIDHPDLTTTWIIDPPTKE